MGAHHDVIVVAITTAPLIFKAEVMIEKFSEPAAAAQIDVDPYPPETVDSRRLAGRMPGRVNTKFVDNSPADAAKIREALLGKRVA